MNKFAKSLILIGFIVSAGAVKAQSSEKPEKHEAVEGKKYKSLFYQKRNGEIGKSLPCEIKFKGGKMYADLMEEKIYYPPYNYKILGDSTFNDEGDLIKVWKGEVVYEEENNTYEVKFFISEYDITGTFKLKKGGVVRKEYEFEGGEITK